MSLKYVINKATVQKFHSESADSSKPEDMARVVLELPRGDAIKLLEHIKKRANIKRIESKK